MEITESVISITDCLVCIHGKQYKLPKISHTCATHAGELLHMDLAGPMETTSFHEKNIS